VLARSAAARLAVVALTVSACSGSAAPLPTGTAILSTADGAVSVRVEIAEKPDARATGLMGRTALASDAGMAFLFDEPTRGPFWMKDTLIPLSIAFWDEEGRIVAVLDMSPCSADPCPRYQPGSEYVGALEVNVGFFRDHGVAVGDLVRLDR
jgi:uncharacterized protein